MPPFTPSRVYTMPNPKLTQLVVADFQKLEGVEEQLTGYDGCFYCAGTSSVGMSEQDYTVVAYDTPLAFATTLARLNPTMVFTYEVADIAALAKRA